MELLNKGETHRKRVDANLIRGEAQWSQLFFEWLLKTFTKPRDSVIDVFASCGGLGFETKTLLRHCFCMDRVLRTCYMILILKRSSHMGVGASIDI